MYSLLQLGHPSSPAIGHWCSWFLTFRFGLTCIPLVSWIFGLWTPAGTSTISPHGSQDFGLQLNYTTIFTGSLACRQRTVECSLHDHVSQWPMIHPIASVSLINIISFSWVFFKKNPVYQFLTIILKSFTFKFIVCIMYCLYSVLSWGGGSRGVVNGRKRRLMQCFKQ